MISEKVLFFSFCMMHSAFCIILYEVKPNDQCNRHPSDETPSRLPWLPFFQGQGPEFPDCLLGSPADPTLTSIHDHRKNHSLDYRNLCWQNNVSIFHMLSIFVIAFLPRSNRLLIAWLQSPPAVILEPKKRKLVTTSTSSPSICHAVMGSDAIILVF